MIESKAFVGKPVSRVDGKRKVTGEAKYAAEYGVANLAHGYVVSSTIANGRIASIDASAALAMDGVICVYTHENRPKASDHSKDYVDPIGPPGKPFRPLSNDRVLFSSQPIALVVAETFEAARDASALVKVVYEAELFETNLDVAKLASYEPPKKRSQIAPPPKPRGKVDEALAAAPVRIDAEYRVGAEHHNPMELFGTTCVWNGDGDVTVYDKTQGAIGVKTYLVDVFGFKKDRVRVVNAFVGGGFGMGLRPQVSVFLAVMAAEGLKRSVRVVLTRDQHFGMSYRPITIQQVSLGADASGTLQAIRHDAVAGTSQFEDQQEAVVNWSGLLYKSPNVKLTYELAKIDTNTPADMRAPGAMLGAFAIESAMDELAEKLEIDPVKLRLLNYTDRDADQKKEFTSKSLRECYEAGAKAFGWEKRDPAPRSMKAGREFVGYGMAGAAWEAQFSPTSAQLSLDANGHLTVSCAMADIGTGTYTILTQIAAEALGLDLERVTVKLGDSSLPEAPVEGGSFGAASAGTAVSAACEKLKSELLHLAQHVDGHPLGHAKLDDVVFADEQISLRTDASKSVRLADALAKAKHPEIVADGKAMPNMLALMKYAGYAHSASFVEVRVDEELGTVRVTRVVNAVAAGRILNPKTARSQIIGAVVMAIGATLHEESLMDHRIGRFMNHNFAEYHVPTNADIEDIEVIFVDEHDDKVSPIGVKGLGEIGIVGTTAAIANAIYNATGRRVRSLPITVDKILGLTEE